jgi:hypothetical protein
LGYNNHYTNNIKAAAMLAEQSNFHDLRGLVLILNILIIKSLILILNILVIKSHYTLILSFLFIWNYTCYSTLSLILLLYIEIKKKKKTFCITCYIFYHHQTLPFVFSN